MLRLLTCCIFGAFVAIPTAAGFSSAVSGRTQLGVRESMQSFAESGRYPTMLTSEEVTRRPSCGKPGAVPQDGGPVASRDGSTVAWQRWTWRPAGLLPALVRVFVPARDGSRARPVSVPGRGKDHTLALSPDGSEVLIERVIGLEESFQIILASTRRAESRFVTPEEEAVIRRRWRTPEWSPDGRFRVRGDDNGLVVIPAEGGPSRRIETPETGENSEVSWSPDGQRIAFRAIDENTSRLYSVRVDGSALRNLAQGRNSVNGHAWSPDGSQLVYGYDGSSSHSGYWISVVRADGSGGRDLAGGLDGPDRRSAFAASWLDNRTIVFDSRQYKSSSNRVADIHTIRSDGSGERRITYQCHLGTRGDNTISGSDLPDTIRAFAGNDRVEAGRGPDDIDAGTGNDSVTSDDASRARKGARDIVRCGPGRDTVVADRQDRVSRDCERVRRSSG